MCTLYMYMYTHMYKNACARVCAYLHGVVMVLEVTWVWRQRRWRRLAADVTLSGRRVVLLIVLYVRGGRLQVG